MKKIATLITLFFILTNQLTFCQTYTKSKEPHTMSNDQKFNVGDTIMLGTPADFSNTYLYFTQGRDFSIKKDATGRVKLNGKNHNYDNRFSKHVIKHFRHYSNGETFAVVDPAFNIMIKLDQALQTGEVLSIEQKNAFINNSIKFSDSLAYLFMTKFQNSVTLEQSKEFMYLFDRENYNKIREDEFEFHEQLNTTRKEMLKSIANIKEPQEYKIWLKIDLGNYNFEKKGFPLIWKDSTVSLLREAQEAFTPSDINNNKIDLTELKLKFINFADFDFLHLNKERANYFVKYRKRFDGNVNRAINIYVHFNLLELTDIEIDKQFLYFRYVKYAKALNCEITTISCFEDSQGYNWLNNIH